MEKEMEKEIYALYGKLWEKLNNNKGLTPDEGHLWLSLKTIVGKDLIAKSEESATSTHPTATRTTTTTCKSEPSVSMSTTSCPVCPNSKTAECEEEKEITQVKPKKVLVAIGKRPVTEEKTGIYLSQEVFDFVYNLRNHQWTSKTQKFRLVVDDGDSSGLHIETGYHSFYLFLPKTFFGNMFNFDDYIYLSKFGSRSLCVINDNLAQIKEALNELADQVRKSLEAPTPSEICLEGMSVY